MQINLSGHHVDISEALRNYVESKFIRLQRHFDQITHTDVLLIVENSIQKSEAKIQVSGAEIFAAAESENMYIAIDLMTDKLDRQLIKFKEKTRGH